MLFSFYLMLKKWKSNLFVSLARVLSLSIVIECPSAVALYRSIVVLAALEKGGKRNNMKNLTKVAVFRATFMRRLL